MKKIFLQIKLAVFLILIIIVGLFFYLFNPQGLTHPYGTSNGKFADRVDSFSEYIVRNTVKRNILDAEKSNFLPIITKGYAKEDYTYYPEGYRTYYSNLTFQITPITLLAKLLKINTELELEIFFGIIRILNAFLFSIFLSSFFLIFCKTLSVDLRFIIPFFVGCSSGFIFFSQNLYFLSSLIVLPAFYIAVALNFRGKINSFYIILFGIFYFLRGYEFATVFALFTAFTAAIFTTGTDKEKVKSGIKIFFMICLSFMLSVTFHILFVSLSADMSLIDSVRNIFSSLRLRTLSTHGVPTPFSNTFFSQMISKWKSPAFSIMVDGFQLSQLKIIIIMIFALLARYSLLSVNEKIIYIYGFLGYASWYIFAYQHIMGHGNYDWYIFSLTMGLSFSLITLLYLSYIVNFFRRST